MCSDVTCEECSVDNKMNFMIEKVKVGIIGWASWGGGAMCHPPVPLIEAFNDGAK